MLEPNIRTRVYTSLAILVIQDRLPIDLDNGSVLHPSSTFSS